MNLSKIKNFAIVGLKILVFAASGLSAYFGIKDLVNRSHPPETDTKDSIEDSISSIDEPTRHSDVIIGESGLSRRGQKIIGILGIISSVCLGVFEVVKSLGNVTNSVDHLLNKKKYAVAGRDGYIGGNYPWNTPERQGLPNNVPIYRGQDGKKNDIYWIQREEGITDVW